MNKKLKENWWYWVLWIIIILAILNYFWGNNEENCDLTFSIHTYNDGCATACSIKCSNNGFDSTSSAYFEPYLSAEEMMNPDLYKQCTCNCRGCRG